MCACWNISFVNRESIRLGFRVDDTASRPAAVAVLLSDDGSAGSVCGSVAPVLAGLGVRCYSLDFRGRGRSAGDPVGPDLIPALVADVQDLLFCIADDVAGLDVFVVGQGMGVRVALQTLERDASGSPGSAESPDDKAVKRAPALVYGPAAARVRAAEAGARGTAGVAKGSARAGPVLRGVAIWAPDEESAAASESAGPGRVLVGAPGLADPTGQAMTTWVKDEVGPWILSTKGNGAGT